MLAPISPPPVSYHPLPQCMVDECTCAATHMLTLVANVRAYNSDGFVPAECVLMCPHHADDLSRWRAEHDV